MCRLLSHLPGSTVHASLVQWLGMTAAGFSLLQVLLAHREEVELEDLRLFAHHLVLAERQLGHTTITVYCLPTNSSQAAAAACRYNSTAASAAEAQAEAAAAAEVAAAAAERSSKSPGRGRSGASSNAAATAAAAGTADSRLVADGSLAAAAAAVAAVQAVLQLHCCQHVRPTVCPAALIRAVTKQCTGPTRQRALLLLLQLYMVARLLLPLHLLVPDCCRWWWWCGAGAAAGAAFKLAGSGSDQKELFLRFSTS